MCFLKYKIKKFFFDLYFKVLVFYVIKKRKKVEVNLIGFLEFSF